MVLHKAGKISVLGYTYPSADIFPCHKPELN